MTAATLRLQARLLRFLLDGRRGDDGQATTEYALVLLGAATIAMLVVAWANKTNTVDKLLDVVFGQLLGKTGAK